MKHGRWFSLASSCSRKYNFDQGSFRVGYSAENLSEIKKERKVICSMDQSLWRGEK